MRCGLIMIFITSGEGVCICFYPFFFLKILSGEILVVLVESGINQFTDSVPASKKGVHFSSSG